jgi:hypothetical protein
MRTKKAEKFDPDLSYSFSVPAQVECLKVSLRAKLAYLRK